MYLGFEVSFWHFKGPKHQVPDKAGRHWELPLFPAARVWGQVGWGASLHAGLGSTGHSCSFLNLTAPGQDVRSFQLCLLLCSLGKNSFLSSWERAASPRSLASAYVGFSEYFWGC